MKSLPRLAILAALALSFALAAPTCGEDEPREDTVADTVDTVEPADTVDTVGPADTVEPADTSGSTCEGATPGGACEGTASCDIGQECCCSECHPSLRCACAGGMWACYYTDACLIPACPDATDADVSDARDIADADDASAACASATTAVAAALYKKPQAFSVVVRLAHDTHALLSYAIVAGAYAHVDEAAARAASQSATGFGSAGQNLAGADPEDAWVFYQSPGDFGGVGVVSTRTGLAVFGGGIVWDGAGDITYPAAWSPASELASGCPASGGLGSSRGFDLVTGQALSEADVKAATDVVLGTAVPAAVWHGGYAFDTVVLRYPRSVGVFDPSSAEWIVIVSGGWLE